MSLYRLGEREKTLKWLSSGAFYKDLCLLSADGDERRGMLDV